MFYQNSTVSYRSEDFAANNNDVSKDNPVIFIRYHLLVSLSFSVCVFLMCLCVVSWVKSFHIFKPFLLELPKLYIGVN